MHLKAVYPRVSHIALCSNLLSYRFLYHRLSLAVKSLTAGMVVMLLGSTALANTPNDAPAVLDKLASDAAWRQAQQDTLRNEALLNTPQVSIDTSQMLDSAALAPANEDAPCFVIDRIMYSALDDKARADLSVFDFALAPTLYGSQSPLGQCLGMAQINQLVGEVQNRIIERGYVTTRVVISPQNLAAGALVLTIIPGYIDKIRTDSHGSAVPIYTNQEGVAASVHHALSLKPGDILNIRPLESALETLKRIPSAEADFKISPSQKTAPGYSDIDIEYTQARKFRLSVGIDDSGAKSTGKYQGNVTLNIDNPSHHNDLLSLSYGRDLGQGINRSPSEDKGSVNYALGYVLPINNLIINPSMSHYTYDQTVVGANQNYRYHGKSNNIELAASYLANRDASSKTYLKAAGYYKSQNNYIDDTEVDVQRRRIAGWRAGISHDQRFGNTSISGELTYQRGTGAFGALTPPESLFNEGSARAGIYKASLNLSHPFKLQFGDNAWMMSYQALIKAQYAQEALVPSERMAIGGRYSVRGFDGERSLSGDHGLLLRQDLSLNITPAHAVYLGLDAGRVRMDNPTQDALLAGHHLAGAAIGIKGTLPFGINYDVFTGYPLHAPESFGKHQWASGFSLSRQF